MTLEEALVPGGFAPGAWFGGVALVAFAGIAAAARRRRGRAPAPAR